MNITLDQLLASRDARRVREEELLGEYPGGTLLCLTVMLPGAEKRNGLSFCIAAAGVAAVREAFRPSFEELRDLETGYEAFFIVALPALEAKRRCCRIEDTHPLGRLMDLDVLERAGGDGEAGPVRPLGREALGLPPRRCLLCGNEVRFCMRQQTHTTGELLARIREMTEAYEQR